MLKTQYAASPAWRQKLMNAFADGLNFYRWESLKSLALRRAVHPFQLYLAKLAH
jgi:hypothetical protein